jgi:hypothetical protein
MSLRKLNDRKKKRKVERGENGEILGKERKRRAVEGL